MNQPAKTTIEELIASGLEIERRSASRKCWNMPAKIYHRDTFITTCVIKNISTTGARLLLDADVLRLKEFRILLHGFEIPIKAKVIWEGGTVRGVRFVKDRA